MISWINKKRNKKGFTLIELIVVVAILGILIALAIPRFAAIRANAQAGTNESLAASILAAAEIRFVDKGEDPADAATLEGLLVSENYLKEWPAAQTEGAFSIAIDSVGEYTVTYPIPTNSTGYDGTVSSTN